MMRHWLVRILLNLAALVAAAAIGFAGLEATGSPAAFGFSALIYFFLAWGLAVEATRGRRRIGLGAYIGPLFVTYLLLGLVGMVFLTASQAASEINPEAPDITAGLVQILAFGPLLQIVAGGFGLTLVLLISPLVAIIDRPPPAETAAAPDATDRVLTDAPQISISIPPSQFGPSQPSQTITTVAATQPRVTEGETLEELFGLEPSRQS